MARTRTLALLRADIRYQADVEGETPRHPNAQLNRLINQSINAFRLMISRTGHPYYLKESTATATTSGTADYALPSDLIHLYGVDLTVDNRTLALQDYSLIERNDFSTLNLPNTGTPVAFRVHTSGNVRFIPTPDSASYTYKFIYLPTATDLSSDSDTFDGVAGWEDWIVYDVAVKLLTRDDEDEQLAKVQGMLAKREREIISEASKRQRVNPVHRRDYRGREERVQFYGRYWRGVS